MLHRLVLNPRRCPRARRPQVRGGGRTGPALRRLLPNRGSCQTGAPAKPRLLPYRGSVYRDSGSTVKPIGPSNNGAAPSPRATCRGSALPGTGDAQYCSGQPRCRFPRDRMCVAHRSCVASWRGVPRFRLKRRRLRLLPRGALIPPLLAGALSLCAPRLSERWPRRPLPLFSLVLDGASFGGGHGRCPRS
jgi:hypothetical protein